MSFDYEYFNIGYLDSLSYSDTFVHRIDPRIKLIVAGVFIITIVSFPKYEITGLMPYFVYPVFLVTIGDIPFKAVGKKLLFVSPFVIFIGIFNPIIDREIIIHVYGFDISGGWISLLSILMKFALTVSMALLLVATTSFVGICEALNRLKLPEIFTVQLLFLYRYLFVLLEEALRMVRARDARSFRKKGFGARTYVNMITVLLIRTLQRAERIYGAMVSRGFMGRIVVTKTHSVKFADLAYGAGFISFFIVLRFFNVSTEIGDIIRRSFS